MKRRTFIVGVGSTAAWPLTARAQQPDRMRRIGVLMQGDDNDFTYNSRVSAFTQALADLGWTDSRNVRMDVRWYGDDTIRIRTFAQELVGFQPDVVVTGSTPATAALQRETRTIPIVFAFVTDPVPTPLPVALSRGSTARVGTSPALPTTKPRWEASGLSCSRRSHPGSSGS
jgi:putative ABC transport system substrate-binding protein